MVKKSKVIIKRMRVNISLLIKGNSVSRRAKNIDRLGLPKLDPGLDIAIDASAKWLCRAQDRSTSKDRGVASFSYINGWSSSYPETTGYIIPSLLEYAGLRGNDDTRSRAKEMLDWLVSIQLPSGAFQGGEINNTSNTPVTFNTGQILFGLTRGVVEFGEKYCDAMIRAADWLVSSQDRDGCWRKYPSPITAAGEKSYETHVAWALLEADRVEPDKKYSDAAYSNLKWALTKQNTNGWFQDCCTQYPNMPLTHTIGYVLRGLAEGYRYNHDANLLDSCERAAKGILPLIDKNGFLPGRLFQNWTGAVSSACLTGSAQIAYFFLLMYQFTNNSIYRDAGFSLNRYVRRTVVLNGSSDIHGAIKGSFPIDGDYLPYLFPNWACKFFIDSNMLEKHLRESDEDNKND